MFVLFNIITFPKSIFMTTKLLMTIFLHDQIHFLSLEATNTKKSDIS